MILAIDRLPRRRAPLRPLTPAGEIIAASGGAIGRGHAERLMPMIGRDARSPSALPTQILVGVGPGQLHWATRRASPRATAWRSAGRCRSRNSTGSRLPPRRRRPEAARSAWRCSAATANGSSRHSTARSSTATGAILNLTPEAAAAKVDAPLVVGSGRRGAGRSARHPAKRSTLLPTRQPCALRLPRAAAHARMHARSMRRAPDARPDRRRDERRAATVGLGPA